MAASAIFYFGNLGKNLTCTKSSFFSNAFWLWIWSEKWGIKKANCSGYSPVRQGKFSLFCLNPFPTDIVFFTLDSCNIVSEDQFLTWWPIVTIERFEKFKMAAGGHIGKMKNVRITNDTIFNMFLGPRNQIRMFVWWLEDKFSLQGHLKVI